MKAQNRSHNMHRDFLRTNRKRVSTTIIDETRKLNRDSSNSSYLFLELKKELSKEVTFGGPVF